MIEYLKRKALARFYGLYARLGLHTASNGTILKSLHIRLRTLLRLDPDREPEPEPDPDALRILILCGIGDVLWSFTLIPALLAKFGKRKAHLIVHHNGDHRAGRSVEMLKRFRFVSGVSLYSWPIHKLQPVDKDGHLDYSIPPGPPTSARHRKIFDFCLIVNSPLEKGLGLESIATQLGLDPALVNYDAFREYQESEGDRRAVQHLRGNVGKPYIVAYLGALADNTIQGLNFGGLWSPRDWIMLLDRIHEQTKLRIVFVGAPYDASYLAEVCRSYDGPFFDRYINAIGQYPMPSTLAILKNAEFVIGFASGITISAAYLGTPTAIFWRPQHLPMSAIYEKHGFAEGFATDWVPPAMLKSKHYLDLWYTLDTPASIDKRLADAGWYDLAARAWARAETTTENFSTK